MDTEINQPYQILFGLAMTLAARYWGIPMISTRRCHCTHFSCDSENFEASISKPSNFSFCRSALDHMIDRFDRSRLFFSFNLSYSCKKNYGIQYFWVQYQNRKSSIWTFNKICNFMLLFRSNNISTNIATLFVHFPGEFFLFISNFHTLSRVQIMTKIRRKS